MKGVRSTDRMIMTGQTQGTQQKNPIALSLFPPKIPYGNVCYRTRDPAL